MSSARDQRAANQVSKGRALTRTTLSFVGALALVGTLLLGTSVAAAGSPPYGIKPKPNPKPKANPYNIVTTVAIADAAKFVRRSPALNSPGFIKLAFYTPDHEALQTYRIISTKREVGHVTYRWVKHRKKRHRVRVVHWVLWYHIAVPARPNGQTGWVLSSWLGVPRTSDTLIIVSREHFVMHVYRRGRLIFTAPVGVGNTTGLYGSTPTGTPAGHFWIAEAFPSSDPFYGPWAFGTTDYATDTDFPDGSIVGIHGTDDPGIIPGDVSHGCIRLKDPDILKLKTLVGIGTAVWIQ